MDRIGPVAGYALAIACSLFAIELAMTISLIMEGRLIFVFLAAVIGSAIYGGTGPGLLATVLTTLAIVFSPPHMQSSSIWGLSGNSELGMYIFFAILASSMGAFLSRKKTPENEGPATGPKQ